MAVTTGAPHRDRGAVTADPLEYLRAAHTQAEREAEAATKGPWEAEGDDPTDDTVYSVCEDPDLVGQQVAFTRGAQSYANMVHIARHDPAAVLRRIEAERKQLELHATVENHGRFSERGCGPDCDGDHYMPPVCRSCRNYAGDPIDAPCPTIEILAEGWGWTPTT